MQQKEPPASRHVRINALDGSGSFNAYLAVPASGSGPGLVLAQEIFGVNATMREVADYYAEEGYVVLVPDLFWRQQPDVELGYTPADWERAFGFYKGFDEALGVQDIQACLNALRQRPEVTDGKAGVLGFCLGGKLAYLAACRTDADAVVGYYGVGIEAALDEAERIRCPLTLHVAELDAFCPPEARQRIVQALGGRPGVAVHVYPGVDHAFARKGGDHFHRASALMAHERSIATLKSAIGPHFDLAALWDKHCEYEFATRNVDDTMATMVAEPYVNHIPTMTGGVGFSNLHAFYTNHFVNSNPPDTSLTPISRTVGPRRWWTRCCSASRTPPRFRGCCPACVPRGGAWRSRCWPWSSSGATSSTTSTSTGTRPACWCRWACWTRRCCPWRAWRRPASCWTRPCLPTNCSSVERGAGAWVSPCARWRPAGRQGSQGCHQC